MTATRKLSLLGFALLAALLLTFAACGSDDDGTAGDDTDATATEQADDSGGDDDDDDGGDDPTATEDSGDDGEDPTATEDSGDDGGDDGDGSDVCALLSDDEIEVVLGSPAEATAQDFPPFYGCGWLTENFDSVNVSIFADDGAEELYEFSSEGADEIDGVGDRAQYLNGILPLLEILEDDTYISVSVSIVSLEDAEARDAAIALGKKIVDRLS